MKMTLTLLVFTVLAGPVHGSPETLPPLAHETILDAPVAEVWAVFTTAEGWRSLGVAKAEMDFRVGGKIRTHYSPDGTIGDAGTIENTVLAYEPERLLAIKATKTPAGFPFPPEVVERTWSVITFEGLDAGRTPLTIRGHGYGTDEASRNMRAFFEQGNAWTLSHLQSRFAPEKPSPHRPVEVSEVVAAPPAAVFAALTTPEGVKAFLDAECRIELRPGGPFELEFLTSAPEGERGSEGCQVLSWLPDRMFSFTWNAPPTFAHARERRTVVAIELTREDPGHTRVRLTHHGFAVHAASEPDHAEEWARVRAYFAQAWPKVLAALKGHFQSD